MIAEPIGKGVFWKRLLMVNMVFIGEPGAPDRGWALVDTGIPGSADAIVREARERLGYRGSPCSVILTHGHFDHSGAVRELARRWDAPVYVHERELPHITGKEAYPDPDPLVGGGWLARLSPLYPKKAIDLGEAAQPLPADGTVPGLPGWRWLATPGHTDGHISLFREEDRLLVGGDAFSTVIQESLGAVLMQRSAIHGPPAYWTTDWDAARRSAEMLRDLRPHRAVPGHGLPLDGELDCTVFFDLLCERFDELARPRQGRYL